MAEEHNNNNNSKALIGYSEESQVTLKRYEIKEKEDERAYEFTKKEQTKEHQKIDRIFWSKWCILFVTIILVSVVIYLTGNQYVADMFKVFSGLAIGFSANMKQAPK